MQKEKRKRLVKTHTIKKEDGTEIKMIIPIGFKINKTTGQIINIDKPINKMNKKQRRKDRKK